MRSTRKRTEGPVLFTVSHSSRFLSLLILLIVLIPRVIDLDNPGLTWDAPGYLWAGKTYIANLLSLQLDPEAWKPNWEHPPLAKYLMGISIYALKPYGISEVAAARLPNAVLGALTCLVIYFFLKESYTEWVGALAALTLSFLPRFFAHTRYAALDAPETAFATFSIYAFWKGRTSDKWMVASAIFLGMAFSAKVSALSVPLVFLIWPIVTYRREPIRKGRAAKFLVLFPLLAILTFVSLWPLLWVRPEHFWTFLRFHFHHFNIPVYYLGTVHPNGPWHYPLVMTLVTTPVSVIFLATLGLFYALKNLFTANDKMVVLLFIWLLASLLRVSVSYGYDGVRLFLDAFPPLASLAAVGAAWFVALLRRLFNTSLEKLKTIFLFLAILVLVSEVYGSAVTHPYETSYYNEILMAVGAAGNFEATYWGEVYKEVVEWLEENAPGFKVIVPIAPHLPEYYAKTLQIVNKFHDNSEDQSPYFAFQARDGFYSDPMIEYCLDNLEPVHTIRVNGLNVAYIYNLEGYLASHAS